jgi:hypothetical protein
VVITSVHSSIAHGESHCTYFFIYLRGLWNKVHYYCGHLLNWWQGKQKYSQRTCPSAALYTTGTTWHDQGSNKTRRDGKPVTNRLSYGTALYRFPQGSMPVTIWKHCSTVPDYLSYSCSLRRMASSGMLRRLALVITDVSEELSASFIRVTRIGELGTLAVTSNRRSCEEISSEPWKPQVIHLAVSFKHQAWHQFSYYLISCLAIFVKNRYKEASIK